MINTLRNKIAETIKLARAEYIKDKSDINLPHYRTPCYRKFDIPDLIGLQERAYLTSARPKTNKLLGQAADYCEQVEYIAPNDYENLILWGAILLNKSELTCFVPDAYDLVRPVVDKFQILYDNNPANGKIGLFYCKALCKLNRIFWSFRKIEKAQEIAKEFRRLASILNLDGEAWVDLQFLKVSEALDCEDENLAKNIIKDLYESKLDPVNVMMFWSWNLLMLSDIHISDEKKSEKLFNEAIDELKSAQEIAPSDNRIEQQLIHTLYARSRDLLWSHPQKAFLIFEKCLSRCTKLFKANKSYRLAFQIADMHSDIIIGSWNKKDICFRENYIKANNAFKRAEKFNHCASGLYNSWASFLENALENEELDSDLKIEFALQLCSNCQKLAEMGWHDYIRTRDGWVWAVQNLGIDLKAHQATQFINCLDDFVAVLEKEYLLTINTDIDSDWGETLLVFLQTALLNIIDSSDVDAIVDYSRTVLHRLSDQYRKFVPECYVHDLICYGLSNQNAKSEALIKKIRYANIYYRYGSLKEYKKLDKNSECYFALKKYIDWNDSYVIVYS